MNEEIWKDIEGYEGMYAVSNWGRVKSLARVDSLGRRVNEKLLSPGKDANGYLLVNLYKEGNNKRHSIHRLVLIAFNPVEGMDELDCNHLDENKENNNLSNLQWTTHKENINHGTRNDRVAEKNSIPIVQLTIEGKLVSEWKSSREAERECGFTHQGVNYCCQGKLKTYKGYKWMYLKDWLKEHNKGIPKKLYFID